MDALRLRSCEGPLFAESWQLYEAAFPLAERRSLSCHAAAMAAEPRFRCLHLSEGGRFAGLAFCWQTPGFIYVEHLAIAPERRGQGLGHQALDLLCGQGLPVILEIEPVVDELTARRWSFYRSAGFHRLPYPHIQPRYHRADALLALELLSYPHAMNAAEVAAFEVFMNEVVGHYVEENLASRA